ncbi:copper resistance CopC family protein [Intrasporangium flavum]|uniref:copper resistance CopC family protein n=1 Tax=Intrasporangium flavum TaxID=1428657 RepID=UPI00096E371B|nr:copper resistance CopC family protein [Intrasporangium flavum]
MRRVPSLLLALGLAAGVVLGIVGAPTVASAHDVLERSNPSDGAAVNTLPDAVELSFAEAPLAVGTQIVVTGPTGNVAEGSPTIEGSIVRQKLAATAPGGDYTVTYRVTSDDGHPVTGSFSFHAMVGLDGSTATAGPSVHVRQADPAADDSSSVFVPVLLTIVGTCVLLGVGGFLVLRSRPTKDADRP